MFHEKRQRSSLRHKDGRTTLGSCWQTYWQQRVCTIFKLILRKHWNMCCKSTFKRRHSATRNTTIADWCCWPEDISSRRSKNLISKREIETRTDLQWELRGEVKQKEKAKNMPNTTPREETAVVGSQEANVHVEKHAHSSMTRTRKAKGRDDLVHLLRQVLRTEIERWWKR